MPSIFNEVIGPVMHGCSSSHVAAALCIELMVRDGLAGKPLPATVTFDASKPLAFSYNGQGPSMGFAREILDYEPDSPLLQTVWEDIKKIGIDIRFVVANVPTDYANTYLIEATGEEGKTVSLEAVSLGGGAIEIRSFAGEPVILRNDYYNVYFQATLQLYKPIYQTDI